MKYSSILVILLSLITLSCEDRHNNVSKKIDSLSKVEQPDQLAHGVTVLFTDSSVTKAILYSKRARIYQNKYMTYLDSGIKVDFMSEKSGSRISVLTADSAQIDDRTKDMLARGNVLVISDSTGTRLETQLLQWNNVQQKIYSTENVLITTPNEIIRGRGFESDPNLINYKISNVSGIQHRR